MYGNSKSVPFTLSFFFKYQTSEILEFRSLKEVRVFTRLLSLGSLTSKHNNDFAFHDYFFPFMSCYMNFVKTVSRFTLSS